MDGGMQELLSVPLHLLHKSRDIVVSISLRWWRRWGSVLMQWPAVD